MEQLVVKNYAHALFEVAMEIKQIDKFYKELKFLEDTFNQYPQFYELFKTPQIANDEKKQIFENVFKGKISNEVMNFLKVILDKRRATIFKDVVKVYHKLMNDYNNVLEATAITVVPLKKEDKQKLVTKLSNITKKQIILKNELDPSIIGGVLVKIGDKVIDGTVQSRLNDLRENFSQIIV